MKKKTLKSIQDVILVASLSFATFFIVYKAARAETLKTDKHVVIIDSDSGGYVHQYVSSINKAIMNGTKYEIRGNCWSACTLYLRLVDHGLLCVHPSASFHFHQPRVESEDGEWVPAPEAYQDWFIRQYPNKVQMILTSYGGLSWDWFHLVGDYWLGEIAPLCEESK